MSALFRKTAGALCRSGNSFLPNTLPGVTDILRLECNVLNSSKFTSQHRWSSLSSHIPGREETVSLNNLRDNPGATKQNRRVGRGIGSSKGKTAGRGHKGQKARSGGGPKLGFEGGQSPMRLRIPKRGFHNPFEREYQPLNLDRLSAWLRDGRLDPSRVITMKQLRDSGAVRRHIKDGIKLLAKGCENFNWNIEIEVSQASRKAREAVQQAGGQVTTVYYNKLGLRALVNPEWFVKKQRVIPRPASPPPKLADKFDRVGSLVSENQN